MPRLIIIGGPNGSGKSTFGNHFSSITKTPFINPDELHRTEFTNPDESYFPYYLKLKVEEQFERHSSFLYESNLHNPQAYEILDVADKFNFEKHLIYFSTDHVDTLVKRVQNRASLGLHNVPKEEILKRYKISHQLLSLNLTKFDVIDFYDTSKEPKYILHLATLLQGDWKFHLSHQLIPKWLENIRS